MEVSRRPRSLQALVSEARTRGVLRLEGFDFRNGLPTELRQLGNLRQLTVRECRLRDLPPWLEELEVLETLDLFQNNLRSIPEVLNRASSLKQLGLGRNSLSAGRYDLRNLVNLRSLDLGGNSLNDEFRLLTPISITCLSIASNDLSTLPDFVAEMGQLTHLYLWGNKFQHIESLRGGLPDLRVLELSMQGSIEHNGNNAAFDAELQADYLSHLVGSPSETYPFAISSWFSQAFPNLHSLCLGSRELERLPESLQGLRNLSLLSVPNNHLTALPPWLAEFSELRAVSVANNSLTDIGILRGLPALTVVNLVGNPLAVPPEILEAMRSRRDLDDYFERFEHSGSILNEAKVILVGEGSVGKTSLVRAFVGEPFRELEEKTAGIAITPWHPNPASHLRANIWDFGGQEIMHATHQFFMTKRSVYLLVIDCRQSEEQNRLEYWLKLIQSFSDNSPVLIVGNKADQGTLDIDRRGLMAKYPFILGVYETSCRDCRGVVSLQDALCSALSSLPHVNDQVPSAFFAVKQKLEEMTADFLSFGEYRNLCRTCGIQENATMELLVKFLHDLGTVLCFRDDPRLADTNILNPAWVTSGVYRILNSHLAAQRKGLLTWDDITSILDGPEYPEAQRPFIIDMMKKFELCFESESIFLVPDLLSKEEPDTGLWAGSLTFAVKYDVLPSSIISRLIVRLHTMISHQTIWRTGGVFAIDDCRALVRADREDGLLRISVDGPLKSRRGALTALRAEIRAIERTIPGLRSQELVVLDRSGLTVSYRHLQNLEEAGIETFIPEGSTDIASVAAVLDGIETSHDRVGVDVQVRQPLTRENGDTSEALSDPIPDSSKPWSHIQAIRLGVFLLISLICLMLTCAVCIKWVGPQFAAALTLIVAAVVIAAFFMLRSAGMISERGLLSGLRDVRLGRSSTLDSSDKVEG